MARKTLPEPQLTEQSIALAEFAARVLADAELLAIKEKVVDRFPLDDTERAIVARLTSVPADLRKKLAKKNGSLTIAEAARIVMALAESLLNGEPLKLLMLLLIAKKLADCLQDNMMPNAPAKSMTSSDTDTVFQFKITLLGTKPPIWRRIQVRNCTLDNLHEHIQTSMGWTNSHLHQFEINDKRYGDPELLDDGFEGFECVDSTRTMLSDILPTTGKRFAFRYEYDFGDGWEHEVLFEGRPPADAKTKYPVCLEGERACPPEDCGGVWGYADFVKAIGNKRNKQHKEMLEWVGGRFDPEKFDPSGATREMKRGLPDWRRMG